MAAPTVNTVDLFSYFDTLSVKHLQRMKIFLEQLIKDKTPDDCMAISELDIHDFISYRDGFVTNDECTSMLQSLKRVPRFQNTETTGKTKSFWLSRTDQPYEWTSMRTGNVVHNRACPLTDFPEINELLDKVNLHLGSDLNSCLVAYYSDGKSGIRLHDDFEHTLDNDQPIAVVSFGAKRTIDFFHNHQSESQAPAASFEISENSLYVMKAKCQEFFRHRVPQITECTSERFSLSFRKVLEKSEPGCEILPKPQVGYLMEGFGSQPQFSDASTSPVKANVELFERIAKSSAVSQSSQHTQIAPTAPPPPPQTAASPIGIPSEELNAVTSDTPTTRLAPAYDNRNITLLLGTSMTRWVKPDILSDSFTEFINVSYSGACIKNYRAGSKVPDMGEMVQKFALTNHDKVSRVKHVIVSVGTNDIKHYRTDNGPRKTATPGDMEKFHRPLVNLVKSIRYFFGRDVRISFQSVLPMRLMYTYTASNFLNFNLLLKNVCSEMNCHYLDWFHIFLDSQRFDHNKELFSDPFHLNRRGYDMLHKCFKNASHYEGCFSC